MEKRVVITGLGAVTPVGIGKENFYNALLAGQSGIGPITRFDASEYATRIAGEVKDFDITNYGVDKKKLVVWTDNHDETTFWSYYQYDICCRCSWVMPVKLTTLLLKLV